MADFNDPFAEPMAPAPGADLFGRWNNFLESGGRTALLQAGLQLMQPQGFGQTTAGAIGQAIGAGGEALARRDAAERADRGLDIKEDLADARMQQVENAATNAAQRLEIAGQGLELRRQKNEDDRTYRNRLLDLKRETLDSIERRSDLTLEEKQARRQAESERFDRMMEYRYEAEEGRNVRASTAEEGRNTRFGTQESGRNTRFDKREEGRDRRFGLGDAMRKGRDAEAEAKDMTTKVMKALENEQFGQKNPALDPYRGKTPMEIKDLIRKGGGARVPQGNPATPITAPQPTPTGPGAQLDPDVEAARIVIKARPEMYAEVVKRLKAAGKWQPGIL